MANATQRRLSRSDRRTFRVRKKLIASTRPRLSVYRTSRYIYAQVIDDVAGKTLAQANSLVAVRGGQVAHGGNCEAAKLVGKSIAEAAKAAGVDQVVFDRGPYQYHGRVKALADAAREAGLAF